MSKIDWEKEAPEGATHCLYGEACGPLWFKQDNCAWDWVGGEWRLIANDLGEFSWSKKLIERPTSPAWNGEGMPPVGTVCEIASSTEHLKIKYPEGARVKIYANFTDDRGVELAAFVDSLGNVAGVAIAKCFRPIRTPEQTATEDRLNKIRNAHTAIARTLKELRDVEAFEYAAAKVIEAMIDAGYGKAEAQK